jgi:hypothetical protein
MAATKEAMASDIIQKVEQPLKPNFEYTLSRLIIITLAAYGLYKGRKSIHDQPK